MSKIVFYICSIRGNRRAIKRPGKGDSLTQFDGLLNAEVYRCSDYAEFEHIAKNFGKNESVYPAILVENDDGSRRAVTEADFTLSPSSPVADVVEPSPAQELVTPSSSAATGGDPLSPAICLYCGLPATEGDHFTTTLGKDAGHYHPDCWERFCAIQQGKSFLAGGRLMSRIVALLTGVPKARCDVIAKALGAAKDIVRATAEAPGSGVVYEKPFGWMRLATEEEDLLS